MLQLHQRITEGGCAKGVDTHEQRAGIVLAAGQVRGIHQGVDGQFHIRLLAQNRLDTVIAQGCPHTITEQQETFAFTQLAIQKIHHQVLIQAKGALEHMLHARLLPNVILGDALQLAVEPTIHPAIADMRQGKALAAKHQCTQSGE